MDSVVQSSGAMPGAVLPLRNCPAFDCDIERFVPIAGGNPTAAVEGKFKKNLFSKLKQFKIHLKLKTLERS